MIEGMWMYTMLMQVCRCAPWAVLLIAWLPSFSFGASPEVYVGLQGYDFSEKEMVLLQNLGELSAVEEAFIDCLSVRSPEERQMFLVRHALDGQILLREYQDMCGLPREIPEDPAEILEAIMSSLNREYFVHVFKDRKFKLRMQISHWREDTKGRFDDPRRVERLIDTLLIWMKVSPDYFEGDESYERRTEEILKLYEAGTP